MEIAAARIALIGSSLGAAHHLLSTKTYSGGEFDGRATSPAVAGAGGVRLARADIAAEDAAEMGCGSRGRATTAGRLAAARPAHDASGEFAARLKPVGHGALARMFAHG